MRPLKKTTILLSILLIFTGLDLHAKNLLAASNDSTMVESDTPQMSYEDQMLTKLFLNHVSEGNYEWALSIWEEISFKETEELQAGYLKALEGSGQKEGLFAKHQELLKAYPDNQASRFFMAKHYFAKAEAEYQKEMAKYQKNENATTYAYLKRELTRISEDYRKSRDILLNLRKMNPNQKAYLLLLRNCYTRLNNEAEVNKLTKELEELN